MNQAEATARLNKLHLDQVSAERWMVAALIQANDSKVVEATLEAAVEGTGLKMPVHLHPESSAILNVLLLVMDRSEDPTADALLNEWLTHYCEPCPASAEKAIRAWCSPGIARIDAVKQGRRLAKVATERRQLGQRVWPEALYRWFDWDRRLLYIGITRDLATRQDSHALKSSWSRFAARCEVERAPDRDLVKAMEVAAIKAEKPLFNHVHNDTPEARQRLVGYLIEQGCLDMLAPVVSRG